MLRILIITQHPWKETNNIGNTLSNIFFNNNGFYSISNLYCRADSPINNICKEYFRITEKELLKSIITQKQCGTIFSSKNIFVDEKEIILERKFYNFFAQNKYPFFLYLREFIWKYGKWKSKYLNQFIQSINPDIIFIHGFDCLYMWDVLFYVIKLTNAKLVTFITDDIYSNKYKGFLGKIYTNKLRRKIERGIENSSLLYGASNDLCDEYSKIFGKCFRPLYKGVNIDNIPIKHSVNNPIKIVFAGNLYFGRWKTLALIAEALSVINKNQVFFKMDIYTYSFISKRISKSLKTNDNCKLHNGLGYNEIRKVFIESDIVLHVESFEDSDCKFTRLSFSTKITDYIESGSCIIAIGSIKNASINYLMNTNAALVCTDKEKIIDLFSKIIKDKNIILTYTKKMKEFAMKNLNKEKIRNNLMKDLFSLKI